MISTPENILCGLVDNEILENTKNAILAIYEHFSLGQWSNSSFQNRGLFHVLPLLPSYLSLSLPIVEVTVIMSDI